MEFALKLAVRFFFVDNGEKLLYTLHDEVKMKKNKKKLGKEENKDRDFSKIATEAKKYFESLEFKHSSREMEKTYNTLSPERLLKRMTI